MDLALDAPVLPVGSPLVRPVGAGECCAAVGTQWGPVRVPGPMQCPAVWDIGLLSGMGEQQQLL